MHVHEIIIYYIFIVILDRKIENSLLYRELVEVVSIFEVWETLNIFHDNSVNFSKHTKYAVNI